MKRHVDQLRSTNCTEKPEPINPKSDKHVTFNLPDTTQNYPPVQVNQPQNELPIIIGNEQPQPPIQLEPQNEPPNVAPAIRPRRERRLPTRLRDFQLY